jgi:uncharacterized membrane-anchored protein
LPMQPVDPRSLLSGHYVIVDLQEPLPIDQKCPPISVGFEHQQGASWVAIAPYEGRHRATGAAATKEEAQALGPIVARGTLYCDEPTQAAEGVEPSVGRLSAELGPERFYIGMSEAKRIEGLMRGRNLDEPAPVSAILSVDGDGRARLKGLLVEGERLELGLT